MQAEQVIMIISILGTAIGSFSGVLVSNKLTTYRIQQLELKVDKHNNFAQRLPVLEEKIKTLDKRVNDIEVE